MTRAKPTRQPFLILGRGTMTEEHKTKCNQWCVIWIEDEDTISTWTEKDEGFLVEGKIQEYGK